MNRFRCLKSKLWPFHDDDDVRSYSLASHATNSRVAFPGCLRDGSVSMKSTYSSVLRVVNSDEPDDTRVEAVSLVDEQRTVLCCGDGFVCETDHASFGQRVGALADALRFRLTDTSNLTKIAFRGGCDVVTRLIPIPRELRGGSVCPPESARRPNLSAGVVDTAMRPPRIKRNAGEFGCPLPTGWSKPADGKANALVVDVGLPHEIVTSLHGSGEERRFGRFGVGNERGVGGHRARHLKRPSRRSSVSRHK